MRVKSSTIFVTGGAGFIGSAMVRHLLRDIQAPASQPSREPAT